ncbi:MAG: hypothetical protein AB8F74_06365 [Saprospiraceae bacterium]
MKKTISNILSQIIPVMIGVYLGFAMNNFGENRKLESQSETYKLMLKNEIGENLDALKSVSDYHVTIVKNFTDLLKSEDLVKAFQNTSFEGFRPGFVSSSAYNTGVQTGIIQAFDLNLIQTLNRLYTLQGKYNRFNENMINSFLGNKFPETESEIRSVLTSSLMSMNDVIIFENELMKYYSELLNKNSGLN